MVDMGNIQAKSQVHFLTTECPPMYKVGEIFGVVSVTRVVGANIVKDFWANIVDNVGGRASGYEKVIEEGISSALLEMGKIVKGYGGNAVLTYRQEIMAVGKGTMFSITVYGTAVELNPL